MALYEIEKDNSGAPTGNYNLKAGGTLWADSPIGTILAYGGTNAPSGWLICNGASLLRTDYPALFAAIGTAFGSADATHFNIPDLRGKTAMGVETDHALGASEDGALPNIEGSATFGGVSNVTYNIIVNQTNGAFTSSYSGTANPASTATTTGPRRLEFDASRSSSIYTNGQTKVDPANVRVNYIIKAQQVALPADFINAVNKAITVKKGTWTGDIILQKMGDAQTRDRYDIPVTFDTPMPDNNYTVVIEFFESRYVTVRSASKTAAGFHIEGANADNAATSHLTKITWTAIRFPS